MSKNTKDPNEPTLIKKYANRRLYDTGRSSYVTLDDLREMVQEKRDFIVVDAKSGEDITHAVLTQIIAEQESQGENLLPTSFLRNLIGFYGDSMQGLVPNYLESTLDVFVKNQEQMREQLNKSFGKIPGMNNMFPSSPASLEELSRKNMELFENAMNNAMKMFSPFGNPYTGTEDKKPKKEEKSS